MLNGWEETLIGRESGRATVTVTREMVDQHLEVLGLGPDWLGGEDAGAVAPIDLLPRILGRELIYKWNNSTIGQCVRAKQRYRFVRPILVGTSVTAVARVKDKYVKRDNRFIEYEVLYTDEAGDVLLRDERVLMVLPSGFKSKS